MASEYCQPSFGWQETDRDDFASESDINVKSFNAGEAVDELVVKIQRRGSPEKEEPERFEKNDSWTESVRSEKLSKLNQWNDKSSLVIANIFESFEVMSTFLKDLTSDDVPFHHHFDFADDTPVYHYQRWMAQGTTRMCVMKLFAS